MRHFLVVTLLGCGLMATGQLVFPFVCRTEGYFGPMAKDEPCFDSAKGDLTKQCDFVCCVFYPGYNTWMKLPYVCPGSNYTDTFHPETGMCGPKTNTTAG